MTPDDFRTVLQKWGLKELGPVAEGHRLYLTSAGHFLTVEDPESLSAEQRDAYLGLLEQREGFPSDH